MLITAWDIKEAAFSSDFKDVEELILTNKGATDVGAVAHAVSLRSLSLAFNSLSSLHGLTSLVRLQMLNVSHNQLASLKGLQTLTCLVTLNASHNKVVSLAPLSGLSSLADLWLQNNAVAAPGELRVLGTLSGLQRLAISNNPVTKALPGDQVRLVALRLCPGLRVVDGRPVEAIEIAASEMLDLEDVLAPRQGGPAGTSAAKPTLGSVGSLGSRPGSGRAASAHRDSDGGSGVSTSAARSGGSTTRPSSGALGLPDSRLPAAASRHRSRSNSFNSLTAGSPRLPAAGGGSGELGLIVVDDSAAAAALAAATAALESSGLTSFGSSGSFRSPNSSRLTKSGGGRRPPLPAAGTPLRPATQLQGTQFQAVLDALPRFDSAKLPARYNGALAKRAVAEAVKPPPDAHLVEYEAKYATQRGGGKAVVVRRDGSAAAFWPGGDMAVTVDAEYGSATVATASGQSDSSDDDEGGGREGGRAAAPVSYRMMVMYRAGGVAVSWDAQGGFAQYPSGGLMLIYSRVTGSGTCYSPSGEITRRWRDLDATAAPAPPPAVTVTLPYQLAFAASPRSPPPPPPAYIDMQLDPHLGVRFISATHSLELYLSCEAVRYRFRCGRNTPGDVWEPPPGRGDGASGGNSTVGSHVAKPQSDSLPPTPTSMATRATPVVGEAYGSGGSGSGTIPMPSFLRNLARQGGAGTHRPVGPAAVVTRQGSSLAGATSAVGREEEAGGGGIAGIASITAGLQALDDGLQAWLARDSKGRLDCTTRSLGTLGQVAASPLLSPSSILTLPMSAPARCISTSSPAKGRRTGSGSGVSAARALAAEVETTAAAVEAESNAVESAALVALAAEEVTASNSGAGAGGGDGIAVSPMLAEYDGGREEADGGGGGGKSGIDSNVAEQLAAARRLAADSLAAALAAASAAESIGSS